MDKLFDSLDRLGADFASIRHERTDRIVIQMLDDVVKLDVNDTLQGCMIKVLAGGSYGYRDVVGEPTLNDLELALKSKVRGEGTAPDSKPIRDKVTIGLGGNIGKDMEEKILDVENLRKLVLEQNRNIKTLTMTYIEYVFHKEYANSYGSHIIQDFPRNGIVVNAVAREGAKVATAAEFRMTNEGYVFDIAEKGPILQGIQRRLSAQLKGSFPRSGKYEAVLAPAVVGTFCHEAFGHLAEADLAEGGFLLEMKGRKLADPEVSITDYPFMANPLSAGFVPYDDEGTRGRPAEILKEGVVNEFMTDLHFARKFGTEPTGNARAQDFRSRDIIRMRNTYVERGKELGKDELIESVRDGYLIVAAPHGQTTSDGTFMFTIEEGYRIKDGELQEGLSIGSAMSGSTLKTLARITGVSKDGFDVDPGVCGKNGQAVPISCGGPYVRVSNLKVGGNA